MNRQERRQLEKWRKMVGKPHGTWGEVFADWTDQDRHRAANNSCSSRDLVTSELNAAQVKQEGARD